MSGAAKWLRLTVGSLSHIAPGPVARLAHSLYRNPDIARRFDQGQRDLLAEAQAIIDRAEVLDIATPEGNLRCYQFASGNANADLVLLLHAWTGDARAMAAFVDPLINAGYDVLVPDLPGHGASFGKETDAPTAARAVNAMLAALDLTVSHFIGHSFGGGVAGMLAKTGTVPRRFVCIASPSQLSAITDDFSSAFGMSKRCKARFEELVVTSSGMEIADLDGLKIWPDLPTRILLLHAPEDAEIDYGEAERLATMPNATLQSMPGLGHREIVYHQDSIRAALAFLAAP